MEAEVSSSKICDICSCGSVVNQYVLEKEYKSDLIASVPNSPAMSLKVFHLCKECSNLIDIGDMEAIFNRFVETNKALLNVIKSKGTSELLIQQVIHKLVESMVNHLVKYKK